MIDVLKIRSAALDIIADHKETPSIITEIVMFLPATSLELLDVEGGIKELVLSLRELGYPLPRNSTTGFYDDHSNA
jgi:hypothetical protein